MRVEKNGFLGPITALEVIEFDEKGSGTRYEAYILAGIDIVSRLRASHTFPAKEVKRILFLHL